MTGLPTGFAALASPSSSSLLFGSMAEVGEQATRFFLDPAGNALEVKAFADISQLFARASSLKSTKSNRNALEKSPKDQILS
jgi:hypothetical protein